MSQQPHPTDGGVHSASVRAWSLTLLLTLCYTVSVVDRYVLAFVAEPLRRDLGLSDFQLGLLQGFAFSLIYAAAGLPFGVLVDRWSRTRLIALAVTFWSAMTAACGMAGNFAQLALARLGVGAGEAALTPAAYSIMADAFPKRQFPAASMIYSLGPTLATAIAAAVSGMLLGMADGQGQLRLPVVGGVPAWRALMVLVAAPGLLLAIVMLIVPEPRRGASAQDLQRPAFAAFLADHWRTHIPFMLAGMLAVMNAYALSAWMPVILTRIFHWSPHAVGGVLGALGLVCGLAGSLLGGALTTWLARANRLDRALWLAAAAMVAAAVGGVLLVFGASAASVVVVAALVGLTTPLIFMIGPTLLQLMTPPSLRGATTALSLLISVGVGAGAGPSLVGALSSFVFAGDLVAATGLAIAIAGALGAGLFVYLAPRLSRVLRD